MPAKANPPVNRIYRSPAAQEQVRFKPRRKLVTYRRSTGGIRQSRQSTLTQIDFVSPQQIEDDEEEFKNSEPPKRKRRRTEEDEAVPSSSYQTQTLTQLDFITTPPMVADELHNYGGEYLHGQKNGIKPEPKSRNGNISPPTIMGPPKTPSRPRTYEVPSSQSPASPASICSRKFLHLRSPLKDIADNVQVVSSPMHKGGRQKLIKAEEADIDDLVEASQQDTLQQSPFAIVDKVSSNQHFIIKSKWIKEEVQDSEEEEEEGEPETWQDNSERNGLVEWNLVKSSDSQQAEVQLQSNIIQFTQLEPSLKCDSATEWEQTSPPRPSQATTVSLTQSQGRLGSSPKSSSIMSKEKKDLPSHEAFGAMTPSSPLNQVLAPQSQSPSASRTLPRLRNRALPETSIIKSDPTVPFSIGSSQLLTRSQMLPESLMHDHIPLPPLIIEDSDLDE